MAQPITVPKNAPHSTWYGKWAWPSTRDQPILTATPNQSGARRGYARASSQARANANVVCPLGNPDGSPSGLGSRVARFKPSTQSGVSTPASSGHHKSRFGPNAPRQSSRTAASPINDWYSVWLRKSPKSCADRTVQRGWEIAAASTRPLPSGQSQGDRSRGDRRVSITPRLRPGSRRPFPIAARLCYNWA